MEKHDLPCRSQCRIQFWIEILLLKGNFFALEIILELSDTAGGVGGSCGNARTTFQALLFFISQQFFRVFCVFFWEKKTSKKPSFWYKINLKTVNLNAVKLNNAEGKIQPWYLWPFYCSQACINSVTFMSHTPKHPTSHKIRDLGNKFGVESHTRSADTKKLSLCQVGGLAGVGRELPSKLPNLSLGFAISAGFIYGENSCVSLNFWQDTTEVWDTMSS